MFKNRLLPWLRGNTAGKIEIKESFGKLIRIQGWTSQEHMEIQIKFENRTSTIFQIPTKPSSRSDLELLGFPTYEFSATLCITTNPIKNATINFVPKIRFQKRVHIDGFKKIDRRQLLSKFGLQTLVENRIDIDQIDTNELRQVTKERVFDKICEVITRKGLEEGTLLILLKPRDNNIVHSQLLLLELSRVTDENYLVLILTETEMPNVFEFSWSHLLRNDFVVMGFLENVNPSELSIAMKRSYPNLTVAIMRQGEVLTSLSGILAELDYNHHSQTKETIFLKTRTSSSRVIGAGIVLGDCIPKMQFPRAPLHDWDYIEFSRAINSFEIFDTNFLVGKQSSTFESINKEIAKQMKEQL